MPLCGHCGVIAPTEHAACSICGTDFASPPVQVALSDDGPTWVAMRCRFQCRSCGFVAPLDALDVDGAVDCGQCGLAQQFDIDAWRGALDHAHGVGDLAYPVPEGRHPHDLLWVGDDNPFVEMASTQSMSNYQEGGTSQVGGVQVFRSLMIEAGPGHPVCRKCAVPLAIEVAADGDASTRCATCGDVGVYALPDRAQDLCATVSSVVGPEHRTDRVSARLEAAAGKPISLKYPECNGGLEATRREVAACPFCGTAVWIPRRARVHDVGAPMEPIVWWVGFAGPSSARRELEQGTVPTEGTRRTLRTRARSVIAHAFVASESSSLDLGRPMPGFHWRQLVLSTVATVIALAVGLILALIGEAVWGRVG